MRHLLCLLVFIAPILCFAKNLSDEDRKKINDERTVRLLAFRDQLKKEVQQIGEEDETKIESGMESIHEENRLKIPEEISSIISEAHYSTGTQSQVDSPQMDERQKKNQSNARRRLQYYLLYRKHPRRYLATKMLED